MSFDFVQDWNRPISTILADCVFCSLIGALREAHFRRPRAGKGKKEKRGGGKKGTPPGTSSLLKWMQRKDECNAEGAGFVLIARGEEETEKENRTSKNFRQGRP